MENVLTEGVKMLAINFGLWFNNNYCEVESEKLKKKAWVNCLENTVLINGSDWHYTDLVLNHGKTIDEVYELFLISERKRLTNTKAV